jgi:nitrogenase subunit NifH
MTHRCGSLVMPTPARQPLSRGVVKQKFPAYLNLSGTLKVSASVGSTHGWRRHIPKLEAARLGTAFLGEVPLLLDIRTASDAGTPIVAAAPESEAAKAFAAVASAVWAKLSGAAVKQRSGPRIVVE